jgi:hypothetical protein
MNIETRPNAIEYDAYDIGDYVKYDFTSYTDIPIIANLGQGTVRVEKIDYSISKNGTEKISPYLNFRI